MRRIMGGIGLVVIVFAVAAAALPAAAQGGPDGRTTYQLNLRAGPGTRYAVITVLPAGTGMVFEARTGDMAWLLGRTTDGAARGWVASLYLAYEPGFTAARLPVSAEVIAAPAAQPAAPGQPSPGERPRLSIGWRAQAIFARGQQLGNNPNVFIRFGDSITVEQHFLETFAGAGYVLGPYGYLQDTIDFFAGSFNVPNETAKSGFTCAAVIDYGWANPALCLAGESPLACEVRLKKPSVAIIYFGPNDMLYMSARDFETNMTMLVNSLIDLGVIPVLTTFAIRPDVQPDLWPAFLAAIRRVAAQQGVPLIEFHDAANALPDYGVMSDGYHLTFRQDGLTSFGGDQAIWGTTLREFLSLHMLDELRRRVLQTG